METAVVLTSMPGGVGGQRRKPLPTRLATGGHNLKLSSIGATFLGLPQTATMVLNKDHISRSSGAL